jgi:hypothetical protein
MSRGRFVLAREGMRQYRTNQGTETRIREMPYLKLDHYLYDRIAVDAPEWNIAMRVTSRLERT